LLVPSLYFVRSSIPLSSLSSFKLLSSVALEKSIFAVSGANKGAGHLEYHSNIPAYSLDIHLPLAHTLKLSLSTVSWMLGRTFKALKKCVVNHVEDTSKDLSTWNALQVGMPACVISEWNNTSVMFFPFVSCPNYKPCNSVQGELSLPLMM